MVTSRLKSLPVDLARGALLAPMAGAADSPFRRLCMQMGAAGCVSEMISAKALSLGDKKTKKLMEFLPSERPFGIQLFGREPELMAEGAGRIAEELAPDFIDINMGCPAPKITSGGAGSALMREPELAYRIARAVVSACPLPVSAKIRAGWSSLTAPELAPALQEAGVCLITVHGRTREQMYTPPVDLGAIAAVKAAVSLPVVGNGDIKCPEDALRMLRETGCDGVMVGRGTLGDPFIFRRIAAALAGDPPPPEPTMEQRMQLLRRQVEWLREQKGDYIAFCEARKHAAWYIKGVPGAAKLRAMAGGISGPEGLEEFISRALELACG